MPRAAPPLLLVVACSISVSACCRCTGNFGGGPCTGTRDYPPPPAEAPRPSYRYRIHVECRERIELDRADGDRAAKDGDAKAIADVATPNADFTRKPGDGDICSYSQEPTLSLWVRTKNGGSFRSYALPLEDKRRNVIIVGCSGGMMEVRTSHPSSHGSPCDEPLRL